MSAKHELDAVRLWQMVNDEREDRGISWREAAREMGLTASLFTRMSVGQKPSVDAFLAMIVWTGAHPDELVRDVVREEA